MSIFSGTQKIVQKGGKLYLVSEFTGPDGTTTTSEVEMSGWHHDGEQGLQLAQAPLLPPTVIDVAEREQPLTPGPCIGTADVSPSVILNGGEGNDRLSVMVADNAVLNGGEGDDALSVLQGDYAILIGDDGDDDLSVYRGDNAVLGGGDGNDDLSVGRGDNAMLNGGDGDDDLSVDGGDNAMLNGGDGDDRLHVDGVDNAILIGGAGDDSLFVGDHQNVSVGNAILSGGEGDDSLSVAGGDNDILSGGEGDDQISATESHNSKLFGGSGNDSYRLIGSTGLTTIEDFATDGPSGEHDQIDLRFYRFTAGKFNNFAEVLDACFQDGDGVHLSFDADHSVLLRGVSLASLHEGNFSL